MTAEYSEFLSSIESSIRKNGFPGKRVALPLDRLQQSASSKGLDFDRALELLRQAGTGAEIDGVRIIFHQVIQEESPRASSLEEKAKSIAEIFKGIDLGELAALQGMNKFKLFFKLRELTKKFTPEQMAKMQEFYSNLTDAEKAEFEAKSREAGLVNPGTARSQGDM